MVDWPNDQMYQDWSHSDENGRSSLSYFPNRPMGYSGQARYDNMTYMYIILIELHHLILVRSSNIYQARVSRIISTKCHIISVVLYSSTVQGVITIL